MRAIKTTDFSDTLLSYAGITRIRFKGMISARNYEAPRF
jgi:hypothetical protein